ncbi:UNVERIFIED_CONTAM: hypothetical protein K2H54_052861 [Gekko kuhli]
MREDPTSVPKICARELRGKANTGQMDDPHEQWKMATCNLALIQTQATVVGLLAAVVAVLFKAIAKGYVELNQAAMLCASSVMTAFIAALSLGASSQDTSPVFHYELSSSSLPPS